MRRGNVKEREKRVRCDGLLGACESESFGITDPSLFIFVNSFFFSFFLVFVFSIFFLQNIVLKTSRCLFLILKV